MPEDDDDPIAMIVGASVSQQRSTLDQIKICRVVVNSVVQHLETQTSLILALSTMLARLQDDVNKTEQKNMVN